MCKQQTEEMSSYIYSRLKTRFPGLNLMTSRSSNSSYIYLHLLHATTKKTRYRINAFTIRVSDHGNMRDQKTVISVFRNNVSTNDMFTAYDKADSLILWFKDLDIDYLKSYIKKKIDRKEAENKKIGYLWLRNLAKKGQSACYTG